MSKKFILQWLNFFYPLVKKLFTFQVYAYLALGAANTLLNIGLFLVIYLALDGAPLAVEAATSVSFAVTVFSGFWLHKNFAFTDASNEKKENVKQFSKYFLVSLQGQFSDYLITKALILLAAMAPTLAYIFSTVIMLILNYFLQKYFTFRKSGTAVS